MWTGPQGNYIFVRGKLIKLRLAPLLRSGRPWSPISPKLVHRASSGHFLAPSPTVSSLCPCRRDQSSRPSHIPACCHCATATDGGTSVSPYRRFTLGTTGSQFQSGRGHLRASVTAEHRNLREGGPRSVDGGGASLGRRWAMKEAELHAYVDQYLVLRTALGFRVV